MEKFATLDEVNQTVNLLKSKPEIDKKTTHYKSLIASYAKLIDSIDVKLLDEKDNYISSKLELERIDAETSKFYSEQFYAIWLDRTKDYEIKYAKISDECEANYDKIIAEGEVVRKHNFILHAIMGEHSKLENVESGMRTEFYLLVRQAVENYKKHNNIDTIIVPELNNVK